MLKPSEASGWGELNPEEQSEAEDVFRAIKHHELAGRALERRLASLLARGRVRKTRRDRQLKPAG